MSGVYANNVASRMPIIWDATDDDGKIYIRHGQVYACEGESPEGFVFLVITKEDAIVQVSVREDNVRLDKAAIKEDKEAERKATSKIVTPPKPGGQILPP